MKKNYISILIVTLLIVLSFSGCILNQNETDKNKAEPLTDEDWEYYTWQYTTRNQLFDQMNNGWHILNSTSKAKGRLIELNDNNLHNLSQLYNLSKQMEENSTTHLSKISNFTLSNRMESIRRDQIVILNNYLNISTNYSAIYNRYAEEMQSYNVSSQKPKYISFSNEMELIIENTLSIQSRISSISTKVNSTISEKEWNTWTQGKDTSIFIE